MSLTEVAWLKGFEQRAGRCYPTGLSKEALISLPLIYPRTGRWRTKLVFVRHRQQTSPVITSTGASVIRMLFQRGRIGYTMAVIPSIFIHALSILDGVAGSQALTYGLVAASIIQINKS